MPKGPKGQKRAGQYALLWVPRWLRALGTCQVRGAFQSVPYSADYTFLTKGGCACGRFTHCVPAAVIR